MNRSQTPIHQPEYNQFYPYVGGQQPMISRGYIQNGNFYPVLQPMMLHVYPMQQSNNSNSKHQQIISQQHQQQPNQVIIKKPYSNLMTSKSPFRPWAAEEDQHIMNMVKMHGPVWDIIARTIPDRSGIDIQYRYNELKNRIVLPMPSIQSRSANSFYDDADPSNENKEENSICFMKHVSYNINNNMDSMQDNFEYIRYQDEEEDQEMHVFPFVSPDNEFNGCDF